MKQEWFPERYGGIEIEKFILKNACKSVNEDVPYIKFLPSLTNRVIII